MKNKKIWWAVGAVVLIALAVWLLSGGKKEEKVSFETAKIEKQDIHTSITATGTIEPVTSVTVGTQVSGIVAKLYVDYNSVVKKGQVIAELDKTNLISELNRAKADLSSAQSTLNYETANFKRYQTLFDKGLVSANDYENARLTYDKARQTVASSRDWAMPPSPVPLTVSCCRRASRKARRWLPRSTLLSCSPLPKT